MLCRRWGTATLCAMIAVGAAAVAPAAAGKRKQKTTAAAAQMDESRRALHLLNRFTFGPGPGDVEKVRQEGLDQWFEQQLHPERIDDSALEARLAPFRSLKMDTREIVENFPPPQVIKAVAEGKMPMPSDPQLRQVYEAQIEQYRQRQERKAEQAGDSNANSAVPGGNPAGEQAMSDEERQSRREAHMYAELKSEELLDLPPEQRYAEIMKMPPEERREMAKAMRPDDREQMLSDLTPKQRETLMESTMNPQQVIASEVMQGKLLRDIYSERQMEAVMTDFWFNHFNVFINKGADHYMVTSYERDVIQPHALGKFKDLLEATAKSPAMLFYLDNFLSVGPDSDFARNGPGPRNPGMRRNGGFGGPRRFPQQGRPRNPNQQKPPKRSGLNENYARELMELHTISVTGGYTQQDVTEVAKVFTGWTIAEPRRGGGFEFNERRHEPGDKHVLGVTIKSDGEGEGEKVLDMLAHSPKTAHFVSYKLAQRFVSDNPPEPLVDRMAETFLKKDGDIREVLRTMYRSPEFWAPAAYRAKVKTPLEFVVSTVRATGADVSNAMPLVQTLNRMGMPLYGCQPPTGYKMTAENWVNSSALTERLNFALMMGSGHMRGTTVDAAKLLGGTVPDDPTKALSMLEGMLLGGDVSAQTNDVISKQLDSSKITGRRLDDPPRPANAGVIAGLLLGSPEFQKR